MVQKQKTKELENAWRYELRGTATNSKNLEPRLKSTNEAQSPA